MSDLALDRQVARWREKWNVLEPDADSEDFLDDIWSPATLEEEERRGFVYFIGEATPSEIKIGWSGDPIKRLQNLNTGSPRDLRLLHVTVGDRGNEREWHERFVHLRIDGGEWFRAERDLLAAIALDRRENAVPEEELRRILDRRRRRESAHQLLRERGVRGPFTPAQIRVATETRRWLSAVRGTRHFVLPWIVPGDVAVVTFGTLLRPRVDDPAERQLRDQNKQVARAYTFQAPDGDLFHAPLDHVSLIRAEDFERAEEMGFDYSIPDLIADQIRDGFGRTLVQHDLLDRWRQALEMEGGE